MKDKKDDTSEKEGKATSDSTPIKPRKTIKRGVFVLGEVGAVLLLIAVLIIGLSVWRLQNAPFDVSFAKDYVEAALRDDERGVYATLERATLYWPDVKGPIVLGIEGSRVLDKNNKEIIHVEEIALRLSRAQLLIGNIKPVSLIVKRPSLRVIRTEDNGIDFGFGTFDNIFSEELEDQADDQKDLIAEILSVIKDQEKAIDNSPLASLKSFEIENARTMVEDHKLEATWFLPDFDIRFESIEEGLKTDLHIELSETDNEMQSFIDAEMVLNEAESDARFTAAIRNFDSQIVTSKLEGMEALNDQNILLNGNIQGRLDKGLMPMAVVAEIFSEQGYIHHESLSQERIPYTALKAVATYENSGRERLQIETAEVTLKDVTFRAKAGLEEIVLTNNAEAPQEGYKGSAQIEIEDIPHSAIEPLWPAFLEGDSSEEWIVQKMGGGDLSGLRAEGNLSLIKNEEGQWSADMSDLMAYFAFTNMDMDYRAPLPAVKAADGNGVFDLNSDTLTINIGKGELNTLAVSETQLLFTEVVAEGKGGVEMDINLNGSLRSVFEYISTEPIDLKDELDMDVAKVKGDTDLRVKMSFPTKDDLQIEEIKMDIAGTVTNGYVPDILEGLALEGGPYQVSVNNERYTVKGSGTYGGRAITLDWMEYLNSEGKDFKNKAIVSMIVDEELRQHFGIDLSDFLEGNVPVNMTYKATSDKKSQIYIEADATPATFFVEAFEYSKPPGRTGSATMTAHLNNNILSNISGLEASAPGFKLEGGSISFAGSGDQTRVSQAQIKRFLIGETIAGATIDYEANGLMKILLEGPYLDLRPFLSDEDENGAPQAQKPYEGPPQMISVAVDQMRTADKETVQYAKIYADIDAQGRFNQLEVDAIAGAGDIYLRYKPDNQGRRTFRFEADDAGAALRAFDVYRNIRGGKLVIYAEPISSVYDRNLVGVAQITDFRVVDAPSLARLLGALSLPGILQLLNDDGLSFTKLEAGFDWLYRRKGALLVLKDGRTSGNSLGLTFDGVFDNAAQTVDVSGTIIPLSGINKAIGSIPLLGDILSGGTGAIFAATYSMQGPSENPRISVNPLAVLTPGILRRILFE